MSFSAFTFELNFFRTGLFILLKDLATTHTFQIAMSAYWLTPETHFILERDASQTGNSWVRWSFLQLKVLWHPWEEERPNLPPDSALQLHPHTTIPDTPMT